MLLTVAGAVAGAPRTVHTSVLSANDVVDMHGLDAANPEAVEAGSYHRQSFLKEGGIRGNLNAASAALEMPRPEFAPETAVASASALLRRVAAGSSIGAFRFEFIPRENGQDVFEIESEGAQIVLRGSDPVSMASALNWYLRYAVHRETDFRVQTIQLPDSLPPVAQKIRQVSPARYRWFFNFCTSGYDTTWYDWPKTERLMDWLAMNGVNLALAPAGQEAVWRDLFCEYGFSDDEARAFLGGPSFLPWTLMLNIDHFGGPMPTGWIDRSVQLQKRTVKRMNELGITPVFPAFNGHVPADFAERHPGTKLNPIHWYGPSNETLMLDPKSPGFEAMGSFFVRRVNELFGTNHFYACDTFIEMLPPSSEPDYLRSVAANIHRGLVSVDPDAVWVLQSWMFMNPARTKFWQKPQREAFLGAVPDGNLLVLDMSRGQKARELDWFEGHAWLWSAVHDFGNKTGFFGRPFSLMKTLDEVRKSRDTSGLSGMGMVPEGLSSTPMVYAALMEMTWRDQVPESDAWLADYAQSRYGQALPAAREAWNLIGDCLFDRGLPICPVVQSPDVIWRDLASGKEPAGRLTPEQRSRLENACEALLSCRDQLSDNPSYRYDLVSIVRDLLSDCSFEMMTQMQAAFFAKERMLLRAEFLKFRELMQDMDRLVGTQEDFLLGRWIADARACAENAEDADLYEWNARNILTLWGDQNRNIRDYARRHWAGLISDFYLPRWELFCGYLNDRIADGAEFNRGAAKNYLVGFEDEWCRKKGSSAVEADGDPVAVSDELFKKYRSQ
jgi:alpha-N-acetylglucosaminidase